MFEYFTKEDALGAPYKAHKLKDNIVAKVVWRSAKAWGQDTCEPFGLLKRL